MTECRNETCTIRTGTTGEECYWCTRPRCKMCGCGELDCDDRKCDEETCENVLYSILDRDMGECHACRDGIPSIVREEDEDD